MRPAFLIGTTFTFLALAWPAAAAEPSEQDMIQALTPKAAAPLSRSLGRGVQARSASEGKLELSVQFDYASARITSESAAVLARLAAAMKDASLSDRHFRVEGHTDSTGSALGNTRLSGRRAAAVRDFLSGAGVDDVRLSTIGLGSAVPADREHPEAAINRRVVILSLEQAQLQAVTSSAATVQRITGTMKVKREGKDVALQPGARLRVGDVATTEAGSSALVRLDDGAQLLLRESSTVEVEKLQVSGDTATWAEAFRLASGALRYVSGALGKARPQAVQFVTSTATIGLRGTDVDLVFVADAVDGKASGTYVKVNQGAVGVAAGDGSRVDVAKDEQAFASAPKPATRGMKREPAAVRLAAPADVFKAGAFDELLDTK